MCDLATGGGDIAGVGFSVGFTFGVSLGFVWGFRLGISVGLYWDLLVLAAVVGSGAWDWEGSSQGAGAPVRFLCRDMEDTDGLIGDCTKGCCL